MHGSRSSLTPPALRMDTDMPRSVKVEKAFENLASAARWAGIDTNGLSFNTGNKTNGIAFRIYTVDPETKGHRDWPYSPPGGYLGMTPAEAIKTLDTMRYVFYGFALKRDTTWKEGA
jgi:hypothetical protein